MTFAYEFLNFLKQHGNEEIREYVRLVIEQQAIKRGCMIGIKINIKIS